MGSASDRTRSMAPGSFSPVPVLTIHTLSPAAMMPLARAAATPGEGRGRGRLGEHAGPARHPADRLDDRLVADGDETSRRGHARWRSAFTAFRGRPHFRPSASVCGVLVNGARARRGTPAPSAARRRAARRAGAAAAGSVRRRAPRPVPVPMPAMVQPSPTPTATQSVISAPSCSAISSPAVFLPSTRYGLTAQLRFSQPARSASSRAQVPDLVIGCRRRGRPRRRTRAAARACPPTVRSGTKHDGGQADRGGEHGRRGRGIARRGARDRARAGRPAPGVTPIAVARSFRRAAGVASVVLDHDARDAEVARQRRATRRRVCRRPPAANARRTAAARAAARRSATCRSGRSASRCAHARGRRPPRSGPRGATAGTARRAAPLPGIGRRRAAAGAHEADDVVGDDAPRSHRCRCAITRPASARRSTAHTRSGCSIRKKCPPGSVWT